ncbi:uncharacterized protein LOC127859853 [Dreissena polymorpha]|uniref:uncharacterized protein LOC127859853 n=1 Tax=Dreissena polymorpha TaxID=45954 RepID=UPI002264FAD9|nr:uncharacterized protein LOC127859853 [Dreissena polymorpha]
MRVRQSRWRTCCVTIRQRPTNTTILQRRRPSRQNLRHILVAVESEEEDVGATATTNNTSSHSVSDDDSAPPHKAPTSRAAPTAIATANSTSSPEVSLTRGQRLSTSWVRLERLSGLPSRPALSEDDSEDRSEAPTSRTAATTTATFNSPSSPDVTRDVSKDGLSEAAPTIRAAPMEQKSQVGASVMQEKRNKHWELLERDEPRQEMEEAAKTFITDAETKEKEEVFRADIKWAAANGKTITMKTVRDKRGNCWPRPSDKQKSSKKRARFSSRATIFGNSFLVPRLTSTNHACCGQFPHRKRLVPGTTLLPLFSFWAATHPRSHMVAPKAEETDSNGSKDPFP